jgi:hypothetical protein
MSIQKVETAEQAFLEQILLETTLVGSTSTGNASDLDRRADMDELAILVAEPLHGFAKDFSTADAPAQKSGVGLSAEKSGGGSSAEKSGGGLSAGQHAAAVGEAVVARIRELKLGERIGNLGGKVMTNLQPDRVLQETIEVPVDILGWQLRYLGTGWGRYLCLPLQGGTYTRQQLASIVQEMLQSTVGANECLQWNVGVLARYRRLCFRLTVAGTQEQDKQRVCGFRIAPAAMLCESFGTQLGPDGWLTSETDVDGSFSAGHDSLSGGSGFVAGAVSSSDVPTSSGNKGKEPDGGAAAGRANGAAAASLAAGWREALRARVGRLHGHLEVATAELSDIGTAARQSGASMLKLLKHPIASFGVPLHVVVSRSNAKKK